MTEAKRAHTIDCGIKKQAGPSQGDGDQDEGKPLNTVGISEVGVSMYLDTANEIKYYVGKNG